MEILNDMALYVEVVRAKSFRRAAEALGMPNSTLSRRIAGLEQSIGLRLLHRTTRIVEPTEAGRLYYERCRRIIDEARIAHEQLGEMLERPIGVVRVSLPVDFATTVVAPILTEFAADHPGITFDLDLTSRRVDLISEPVDVAIRMGHQPDSGLIARKLVELPRHVYASPQYLARAGEPQHPRELTKHECLVFGPQPAWQLHGPNEQYDSAVAGRFLLNSIGMMRQLAALGSGLAVLPREIIAEDISVGRLRRVLRDWHADPVPVYAVTETRLLPAKVQRFIEFLRERLRIADGAAATE